MKKVIASVDKRKQFSNTMVPASLGIQSIVIGPGYHEEEEKKHVIEEQTPFLTQPELALNQSQNPRTAKLEPLNSDCMPNSEIGESIKDSANVIISDKDIEELFKKKSYRSNFMSESLSKRKEESEGQKSNNTEIQNRYDNQTTQNLCELMNEANTSKPKI